MPAASGRIRVEHNPKWVRAVVAGQTVVDTRRSLLVWEKPYYPTYYLPSGDVAAELHPTGDLDHSPSRGDAEVVDLTLADGRVLPGAGIWYRTSRMPALTDHVRIDWDAMDTWLEEDEPVLVHPRDPYTRIDALRSSRHILVERDGVVLADSVRPVLLFETGLIVRTYLPQPDVAMDLLVASDTVTRCPYKGTASYLHLRAGEVAVDDLAWTYPFPTRESLPIAGLVAFHDERVDVTVDGVRLPRPQRPFRRPEVDQ
ncbi:MAG: DUF427 domain-containing protein [Nitriliruptoraceae bacterium]